MQQKLQPLNLESLRSFNRSGAIPLNATALEDTAKRVAVTGFNRSGAIPLNATLDVRAGYPQASSFNRSGAIPLNATILGASGQPTASQFQSLRRDPS